MVYFTSDMHFGHQNVISHTNRPYADVEAMDRALIDNWNRRVQPKDEVYILGDITMKGPEYAEEILGQLRGRKYLILGNHDYFADNKKFHPEWYFEWVKDYHLLKWQNERFVLCHYPFEEWNYCRHGAYHLHGHIHSSPDYNTAMRARGMLRYDVGVDANHYAPVALQEILSFFEGMDRQYEWERWREESPESSFKRWKVNM